MNDLNECISASLLLSYDPFTGVFHRISDGSEVGCRHSRGYVYLNAGGVKVLAHRLALFMSIGQFAGHVDHINRNKADNRLVNLRIATDSQNKCNRGIQVNNTSGYSGVALNRTKKKWQAYIKIGGKRKHIGVYDSIDDAVQARKKAASELFGAFAPA